MPEDSRRYISRTGVSEGPYTVDEIYTLAVTGQTNLHNLFWSPSKKAWLPLAGLMLDIDPDRLDQFIKDGVKRVQVFGSSSPHCLACSRLANKTFPIETPPELPPKGCDCIPWCQLVLAPAPDGTDPSTSSG